MLLGTDLGLPSRRFSSRPALLHRAKRLTEASRRRRLAARSTSSKLRDEDHGSQAQQEVRKPDLEPDEAQRTSGSRPRSRIQRLISVRRGSSRTSFAQASGGRRSRTRRPAPSSTGRRISSQRSRREDSSPGSSSFATTAKSARSSKTGGCAGPSPRRSSCLRSTSPDGHQPTREFGPGGLRAGGQPAREWSSIQSGPAFSTEPARHLAVRSQDGRRGPRGAHRVRREAVRLCSERRRSAGGAWSSAARGAASGSSSSLRSSSRLRRSAAPRTLLSPTRRPRRSTSNLQPVRGDGLCGPGLAEPCHPSRSIGVRDKPLERGGLAWPTPRSPTGPAGELLEVEGIAQAKPHDFGSQVRSRSARGGAGPRPVGATTRIPKRGAPEPGAGRRAQEGEAPKDLDFRLLDESEQVYITLDEIKPDAPPRVVEFGDTLDAASGRAGDGEGARVHSDSRRGPREEAEGAGDISERESHSRVSSLSLAPLLPSACGGRGLFGGGRTNSNFAYVSRASTVFEREMPAEGRPC